MGHGLKFSHDPEVILRSAVAPPKGQKRNGGFQDVALAPGSPGLENSAELGALWAANPDLQQVPIPDGGRWPRALSYLIGTRSQPPSLPTVTGEIVYTRLELPGRTGADLDRVIAQYPTLVIQHSSAPVRSSMTRRETLLRGLMRRSIVWLPPKAGWW